jgi:large subunit ribosomal protein L9
MKIIILKDTPKVGKKFDIKDVNDGYALNLLIPKGIAIPATPQAIKRVEAEKAVIEGERKVQEELLAKNIQAIESVTLTMNAKANPKGMLFAGVHKEEISKALHLQDRVEIDPAFIDLDHPLKEVGEHLVPIKAGGKTAKLKVVIKAL